MFLTFATFPQMQTLLLAWSSLRVKSFILYWVYCSATMVAEALMCALSLNLNFPLSALYRCLFTTWQQGIMVSSQASIAFASLYPSGISAFVETPLVHLSWSLRASYRASSPESLHASEPLIHRYGIRLMTPRQKRCMQSNGNHWP